MKSRSLRGLKGTFCVFENPSSTIDDAQAVPLLSVPLLTLVRSPRHVLRSTEEFTTSSWGTSLAQLVLLLLLLWVLISLGGSSVLSVHRGSWFRGAPRLFHLAVQVLSPSIRDLRGGDEVVPNPSDWHFIFLFAQIMTLDFVDLFLVYFALIVTCLLLGFGLHVYVRFGHDCIRTFRRKFCYGPLDDVVSTKLLTDFELVYSDSGDEADSDNGHSECCMQSPCQNSTPCENVLLVTTHVWARFQIQVYVNRTETWLYISKFNCIVRLGSLKDVKSPFENGHLPEQFVRRFFE